MSAKTAFCERVAASARVGSAWAIILPILVQGLTALLAKRCNPTPQPDPEPTPEQSRAALEQALDDRPHRTRAVIAQKARSDYREQHGHRPTPAEVDRVVDAIIEETLLADDETFAAVYTECASC